MAARTAKTRSDVHGTTYLVSTVDGRAERAAHGLRGGESEMPVIHGGAQHSAHVGGERRPGVRAPDAVLLKLPHPVADVGGLEGPEGARTQVREGVQPQLRLHRGLGVRVSALRFYPAFGVLLEGDPGR